MIAPGQDPSKEDEASRKSAELMFEFILRSLVSARSARSGLQDVLRKLSQHPVGDRLHSHYKKTAGHLQKFTDLHNQVMYLTFNRARQYGIDDEQRRIVKLRVHEAFIKERDEKLDVACYHYSNYQIQLKQASECKADTAQHAHHMKKAGRLKEYVERCKWYAARAAEDARILDAVDANQDDAWFVS